MRKEDYDKRVECAQKGAQCIGNVNENGIESHKICQLTIHDKSRILYVCPQFVKAACHEVKPVNGWDFVLSLSLVRHDLFNIYINYRIVHAPTLRWK